MKKNKEAPDRRPKAAIGSFALTLPYVIWMGLFILIPLGMVVCYAFTDSMTGMFTLANIKRIFTGAFLEIFIRSIWYSLLAACICLVVGYPVAYFIARQRPMVQRFLYMLVMLPMCLSFLLRTLAWVGLLRDTGILNNFLGLFGIGPIHMIRNTGAVILGMVYNYLPYMIMPLYTVIMKISPALIEAAQDLGCSGRKVFSKVILPLSVPGIVSGFTMVFVPAVSTFYISQKLGSTGTTMIGDVIESQFKTARNPNFGAALSLVLMILIFACVGLMNRFAGKDAEGQVMV